MIARFKALPESVQQEILDEHRDWDVDHGWWDGVYEMFKEEMKEKGIWVNEMYFSGFWSQGDGACFEGCIDDLKEFIEKSGLTEEFAWLLQLLETDYVRCISISCKSSGRYCHEHTMEFDDTFELTHYLDPEDGLIYLSAQQETEEAEKRWPNFVSTAKEIFRDHARQLYEYLEEEYDYLTSDEHVLESLHANDCLETLIEEYEKEEDDEDEPTEACPQSLA